MQIRCARCGRVFDPRKERCVKFTPYKVAGEIQNHWWCKTCTDAKYQPGKTELHAPCIYFANGLSIIVP